jgi:undecaprenyl-diphosphatase
MTVVVEFLKAILYGIVEGITEWLPVSSTGHLILLGEWLPFGFTKDSVLLAEFGEMFEVVIQLGAIIAVLFLFFNKLNPFAKVKNEAEKRETWILWLKVIVASVPAAIVGLVLDKVIENITGRDIDGWLYNFITVAVMLILYGILFIIVEIWQKKREAKVNFTEDITYTQALMMGCFQVLAIIPGTSRSGSTILGARTIGISRPAAAEFSFFMGIPAMLGASLLKSLGFFSFVIEEGVSVPALAWTVLGVATAVSFAVSVVAIKFLMNFVKNHDFKVFGVYRIALGAVLLIYFLIKTFA